MHKILAIIIAVFCSDIALADIQVHGFLNKAAIENISSDPSCVIPANCPKGRVYWNTTVDEPRIYDGSSWLAIQVGTETIPDPLLLGDGSSFAPTFGPSNYPTTGMYFNATQLRLSVLGTLGITVNSSGITTLNLADGSVSGGSGGVVTDGSISKEDIGTGEVTTSEIFDQTITFSDIGPDAVGNSEMRDDAIGTAEIINNSIGFADIDTGAVRESEIDDGYINVSTATLGANDSANTTICTIHNEQFGRVDDYVDFVFRVEMAANSVGLETECNVTGFPFATSFDSTWDLMGVCALVTPTSLGSSNSPVAGLFATIGTDDARFRVLEVPYSGAGSRNWVCTGRYHIE